MAAKRILLMCCFLLLSGIFLVSLARRSRERKRKNRCTKQKWTGCEVIKNTRCTCGSRRACKNPFSYEDLTTCNNDIRATTDVDICITRNPCLNGGICLSGGTRGYHCECSGTGYYGEDCKEECPQRNKHVAEYWKYPAACVIV